MPSDERCENCRFWKRHDDDTTGDCRRAPPVVTLRENTAAIDEIDPPGDVYYWSRWPATCNDDWCGEYQPKPPATTEDPVKSAASDLTLPELGLCVRTRRALACALRDGVRRHGKPRLPDVASNGDPRVWHLEQLSRDDVSMIAGIGALSVSEISTALASVGTAFRGEPRPKAPA